MTLVLRIVVLFAVMLGLPRYLLPLAENYEKLEYLKSRCCNDNFVVGVEIEVAEDGDMRKARLSNQDSIKAFVLYQVDFAGFIK